MPSIGDDNHILSSRTGKGRRVVQYTLQSVLDFNDLFAILNGNADANKPTELTIDPTFDNKDDDNINEFSKLLSRFLIDFNGSVWSIKLCNVGVRGGDERAVALPVAEVMRIPGNALRELIVALDFSTTRHGLGVCDHLRDSLLDENNNLTKFKLVLSRVGKAFTQSFLVPVILNEHCKLECIEFADCIVEAQAAKALAKALEQTDCKLRGLCLKNCAISSAHADYISSALLGSSCKLERLSFIDCFDDRPEHLCEHICAAMERPGNLLRCLSLVSNDLNDEDAILIAKGMCHSNNRLEELDLSNNSAITGDGGTAIAHALQDPNNKLRCLSLSDTRIDDHALIELAQSLSCPHTRLEQLDFELRLDPPLRPPLTGGAMAIAQALEQSPSNHLERLHLSNEPSCVPAFTCSLRSRSNKVKDLSLCFNPLDTQTLATFYRVARISNLLKVDQPLRPNVQFFEAFNEGFLQVLYTLVSLKVVARLARKAPCQDVPFSELIFLIADTLGWPLDKLSN